MQLFLLDTMENNPYKSTEIKKRKSFEDDMEKHGIELTREDKAILSAFSRFCDGLSEYLGSGYEIVLHSLEDYDHSAIRVLNGDHTGRKEGAPITDLALFMLEDFYKSGGKRGCPPYLSRNRSGDRLMSTTIPIYGENERIIGLMCMNFYLATPFEDFIQRFIPDTAIPAVYKEEAPKKESYMDDVGDVLGSMIAQAREELQGQGISSSNMNREIIAKLQARGIFNLKNAVQECADALGISKNTVYLHLRNLNDR